MSPSSRRAWIEIFQCCHRSRFGTKVALLAEGVDRNPSELVDVGVPLVALLAEGVDRNIWPGTCGTISAVALLAEGVDRNSIGLVSGYWR